VSCRECFKCVVLCQRVSVFVAMCDQACVAMRVAMCVVMCCVAL